MFRSLPADGLWSHFYVFCWSDYRPMAEPLAVPIQRLVWRGGTSFASPIMAGIQALINQKAGGPTGNPAPAYYQLAAFRIRFRRQPAPVF